MSGVCVTHRREARLRALRQSMPRLEGAEAISRASCRSAQLLKTRTASRPSFVGIKFFCWIAPPAGRVKASSINFTKGTRTLGKYCSSFTRKRRVSPKHENVKNLVNQTIWHSSNECIPATTWCLVPGCGRRSKNKVFLF